jgi:DNA-binding LytR/AlgR family response regulator
MNEFARRCLPVEDKLPFDKYVLDFHPENAKSKVKFLLDQAECPVSNAPPMAMMINIPDRMLLIKVSKVANATGETSGYVLAFYDITDLVSNKADPIQSRDAHAGDPNTVRRRLRKIPTINMSSVACIRSEGHYTWIHTEQGAQFCNLNIGDIESRLDPQQFLRVHRSFIVNLARVDEIVREDGRITLRMNSPALVDIPVSRGSAARLMEQLGLADSAPVRA